MSDSRVDDVPILRELGEDLKHAFHAREGAAAHPFIRRFRRPRRLLGAGIVAAVASGFVIAFGLGLQGGTPAPASARAALLQAAAGAVHHPVPFPANAQFYYVRYVSSGFALIRSDPAGPPPALGGFRTLPKALVSVESELWSSAARPGVTRSRMLSLKFETQAGRTLWERLGRPSFVPQGGPTTIQPPAPGHYLLGNIDLTRRQLLEMPTDPRSLYARLYQAGGSPAEVFNEISDTLRNRPIPPVLRSALYRALALVPGVTLIGPVRDSAGRHGTAIGFVTDDVEEELVFDPTSAAMLAEKTIALGSVAARFGVPAGTTLATTTYLQRAVTDSASAP